MGGVGFDIEAVRGEPKSLKSNNDCSCSGSGGAVLMRETKPGGGGIEKNPPLPRGPVLEKLTPPPSSEGPITETVELNDNDFS